MKKIGVIELFAGVGGFRIGLDAVKNSSVSYETIWANQWEPSTTRQHAAEVYSARFGNENFCNEDIEKVVNENFSIIPDHDLLVGGFPCQDYSVARTLKNSEGITGKKGVLFWSIYNILKKKGDKAPRFLFLENVDRLLKSPASQRGKDFAVMLAALSDLGYTIEWKVVNAADYGFPQRRKRTYIVGYRNSSIDDSDKQAFLENNSVMAEAFSSKLKGMISHFEINGDLAEISENFSKEKPKISPFKNCGYVKNREVWTSDFTPIYEGKRTLLRDILLDEKDVPESFFIDDEKLPTWTYLKGAKKEERTSSTGFKYHYSEGPVTFPDNLDVPSRTIITGEGGSGPSRFKHVVITESGKYRRLTPVELERLDMFPDNHTMLDGVSDTKRAFFMGNALVVGCITRVGEALANKIQSGLLS